MAGRCVSLGTPPLNEGGPLSIHRKAGVASLAAGMALALPAGAGAAPAHGHGAYADVPSRIATTLKGAERALDRAQERADDGNGDAAVKQLTAARRAQGKALASAEKKADADSGTAT